MSIRKSTQAVFLERYLDSVSNQYSLDMTKMQEHLVGTPTHHCR